MTHVRDPLTTEQAIYRVIADLKIERCAEIIGKAGATGVGYMRAVSNPASNQRLAFDDAVELDVAYAAEVEPGHYPLFESYRLRLALAAQSAIRDAVELSRHAVRIAVEGGKACAALIEASVPGAPDSALRRAIAELEEDCCNDAGAIGALQEVLRRRSQPETIDTS